MVSKDEEDLPVATKLFLVLPLPVNTPCISDTDHSHSLNPLLVHF